MQHFRHLTADAGINVTQFHAQLAEAEMIELLIGFSRDVTLPASLRRDCARDVLLYARGAIKPWVHDGETIDPAAVGRTGNTISAEIEAIKLSTQAYEEITSLMMKQVPFEAWPPELQDLADPSMASFAISDP